MYTSYKPLLGVKLKNAVKSKTKADLDFQLKTIKVNADKRGCSGFIINPANNACIYVNTEPLIGTSDCYLYRYADHNRDYKGYHNRWAHGLDELAEAIVALSKIPVCDTRDSRV